MPWAAPFSGIAPSCATVGVLLPETNRPRFTRPETVFPPNKPATKLFCQPKAAAMLWFCPNCAAQASVVATVSI
jgi:hypothetical protein